jgi:hypothetical protein
MLHNFQSVSSQGRPLLDCLDLREKKKTIYQSILLHDTDTSSFIILAVRIFDLTQIFLGIHCLSSSLPYHKDSFVFVSTFFTLTYLSI